MDQEIRFCTAPDGVRIAYAVAGNGTPLIKVANYMTHLDHDWVSPVWGHLLQTLAQNHRLIRYDERGTGLSDWYAKDLSFEAWVSDLETVVEATGFQKFALFAMSQAGAVAVAYAARHPERVSHLILHGTYARGWLHRPLSQEKAEEEQLWISLMKVGWGQDNPAFRQFFTAQLIPDGTKDQLDSLNEMMRLSAEPEVAVKLEQTMHTVNVEELAPQVTAPTLVVHARQDACVPFDEGKLLASLIPNARFVALDTRNHILTEREPSWLRFTTELHKFLGTELTGQPIRDTSRKPDRRLATILFTDIIGSTELAATHGDRLWLEVLERHNVLVRDCLHKFSGQEVKTTGDGFAILFDGPAKAIRCSTSIIEKVQEIGIEVRCGVHIGEIEIAADEIGGIGVHIAARVMDYAEPNSTLVTNTVKDASAGTEIKFTKGEAHTLKGVPGEWNLFSVVAPGDNW